MIRRPPRSTRTTPPFPTRRSSELEAHVQREVAQGLAAHIAGLPVRRDQRLLEIGCGNGLLTSALVEEGLSGDWVVSDLSPAMAARCRDGLREGRGRSRNDGMDGERSCFAPAVRFDLSTACLPRPEDVRVGQ